jgi:hypothetical protein
MTAHSLQNGKKKLTLSQHKQKEPELHIKLRLFHRINQDMSTFFEVQNNVENHLGKFANFSSSFRI